MKRNTVTIIELMVVICVIIVSVRVWNYRKLEEKAKLPTPTPKATPTCHSAEEHFYEQQFAKVFGFYNKLEKQLGRKKAIEKTLKWLNGDLLLEEPVPEGIVKAYVEGRRTKNFMIEFSDGMRVGFEVESDEPSDLPPIP
jgi:hypothetical protein